MNTFKQMREVVIKEKLWTDGRKDGKGLNKGRSFVLCCFIKLTSGSGESDLLFSLSGGEVGTFQ